MSLDKLQNTKNSIKIEKPEEVIAKNAIEELYPSIINQPIYEPNKPSRFPDYWFSDHQSILEVVCGLGFSIEQSHDNKLTLQKKSLDPNNISLEKEINKSIKDILKPKESILISLNLFNNDINDLGKAIVKLIKKEYNNLILNETKKLSLIISPKSNIDMYVTLLNNSNDQSNAIIILTDQLNSHINQSSLEAQANFILENSIIVKKDKAIKEMNQQEYNLDKNLKKWLAIVNKNPLLTIDDFYVAFKKLEKNHTNFFHKIFIIDIENKKAFELTIFKEENKITENDSHQLKIQEQIDTIFLKIYDLRELIFGLKEIEQNTNEDLEMYKNFYSFFQATYQSFYVNIMHKINIIIKDVLVILDQKPDNDEYSNISKEIKETYIYNNIQTILSNIKYDITFKEFMVYVDLFNRALIAISMELNIPYWQFQYPNANIKKEIRELYNKIKIAN